MRVVRAVIAILAGCGGESPAGDPCSWRVETVSENRTATTTAVAAGSGGVWIAYDWEGAGLYASGRTGSEWLTERIHTVGVAPVLALGPEGSPVVAYDSGDGIRVSTWVERLVWNTETPVLGEHSAPALGVSSEGTVHLAFVRDGLHWLVRRDAGWTSTDVDPAAEGTPALALDGEAAHVVYRTATGLSHATDESGAWRLEEVWAGSVAGTPALAAGLRVTFAVADGDGGFDVWYATNEAGSWQTAATGMKASTADPRIAPDGTIGYALRSGAETESRALPLGAVESERVDSGPTLSGVSISSWDVPAMSYGTEEGVFVAERRCGGSP